MVAGRLGLHVSGGVTYDPPTLVDVASMPTSLSLEDFMNANPNGEHLDLGIWRVGEKPRTDGCSCLNRGGGEACRWFDVHKACRHGEPFVVFSRKDCLE
jgi:hypothetical protein